MRTRSQISAEIAAAAALAAPPPPPVTTSSSSSMEPPKTWMQPKYWKRLFQSFRPNLSTQRDFKQSLLDGNSHLLLNVNDLRKVAQELQRILSEEGRLEDAAPENFKGVKARISLMIQQMLLKMPSTPEPKAPPAPVGGGGRGLAINNQTNINGTSPLECTPVSLLSNILTNVPQRSTRSSTSDVLGQKRDRGIVIPEAALNAATTPPHHSSTFPSFPSSSSTPSPRIGVSASPTNYLGGTSSIPFLNKDVNSCYPVQGVKGFEAHCSPLLPIVEEIKRVQVRPGAMIQNFDIPPFLALYIQSRRCRILVFPVEGSFDPIEWPAAKNTAVFVNSEAVLTPWKRSWARKDVCKSYLSLDITNLLPTRTKSHRLQIDCLDPHYRRTFVIVVAVKLEVAEVAHHLLRRSNSEGSQLLLKVQYPRFACCKRTGGSGSEGSSQQQHQEDDVQEATLPSMSTKCPISQCPMTIPVRGKHCEHIQPLDLGSYLVSATTSRFTNCPICDATMRMTELVVDGPLEQGLRLWREAHSTQAPGQGGSTSSIADTNIGAASSYWPYLQLFHPSSTIDPLEGGESSSSLQYLLADDAGPFLWMRAVRQRCAGALFADSDNDSSSSDNEGRQPQAPSPPSHSPSSSTAPPTAAPVPKNQPEIIELD